jgi:hypothetical protein
MKNTYTFKGAELRFIIHSVIVEIRELEAEMDDLSQYGLDELEMLKQLLRKLKHED